MQKEFEAIISNFAQGDMDDVVGLFEISEWIAKHFKIEDDASLMEMTITFVNSALDKGFKAGCSPYFETGFKLWDNQERQHVCHEIKSAWKEFGRPNLTTNIWFGLPGYKYD